jgi:hypothetical protein
MKLKRDESCTAFLGTKKSLALISVGLFYFGALYSQSVVYDDFEIRGNKIVRYSEIDGVLDTLSKDPAPMVLNGGNRCASYVRNSSKKFDNIKMSFGSKLIGVDKYATYLGIPPKLKMKIYTTAKAGTLVEILLGSKRGDNDYPAGSNSQYQAYTTVSNQWEQLEFKFSQVPVGSETSFSQVDQVTILFKPNSSSSDTYYFDDLTGPPSFIADPKESAKNNKSAKKSKKRADQKSNVKLSSAN